ncbi:MAG: FHA domain-containing protein [Planctomycetota bacterium]|nr:FHA domain-containing protein [Planctomycetota bacterium]
MTDVAASGLANNDFGNHDDDDDDALKLVLEDMSTRACTPLTKPKLVIGRDMGCDIPVNDRGVSGRHCELELSRGQWAVSDLGSTNGIMINNVPVKSGALRVGDRLTIGKRFIYRLKDPTTRVANVGVPAESESGFPTWLVAISAAVVGLIALVVWTFF